MTMTVRFAGVLTGAVLACAAPVAAHHSWTAQYDATKPLSVKGVVTAVEWTNPHARFYVDVKNEKGEVMNWNFELASPNVLVRNGWTRNTLKPGDPVTVTGYAARTNPKMAIAGDVTGADGKTLFASSTN